MQNRLLMQPSLLEKIARTWVCVAATYYFYDLITLYVHGGLSTADGRAFGEDFINYYSGAALAWHGHAADVYRLPAYHAFAESVAGATVGMYLYVYPPLAMLLAGPFTVLPYVPALFAWLISSWYTFYRALRLAIPEGKALLFALATPALFVSARAGQNGAWTATFIGGGLCLLERRPTLAGILFGLQAYKPHLGLLIPIALLAGRHWRAFFSATVTAVALIAASVALFGLEPWRQFLQLTPEIRHNTLEATLSMHRIVSVFMLARSLGASLPVAYAMQAVSALAAAVVVAAAWLRNAPAPMRNSLLVLGAFLATPYVLDYDLVVGAFVAAWLTAATAMPAALARPASAAAALVLLAPVTAGILGKLTGIQLGPLFFLPAFVLAALQIPWSASTGIARAAALAPAAE